MTNGADIKNSVEAVMAVCLGQAKWIGRGDEHSGVVLDSEGNAVGSYSDCAYGVRGFAVHTKEFGGFVKRDELQILPD